MTQPTLQDRVAAYNQLWDADHGFSLELINDLAEANRELVEALEIYQQYVPALREVPPLIGAPLAVAHVLGSKALAKYAPPEESEAI